MAAGADNLDVAADLALAAAERGVEEARRRAAPEQEQRADGSWPHPDCVDCGGELGERMRLGKVRCITCQTLRERRPWRS